MKERKVIREIDMSDRVPEFPKPEDCYTFTEEPTAEMLASAESGDEMIVWLVRSTPNKVKTAVLKQSLATEEMKTRRLWRSSRLALFVTTDSNMTLERFKEKFLKASNERTIFTFTAPVGRVAKHPKFVNFLGDDPAVGEIGDPVR